MDFFTDWGGFIAAFAAFFLSHSIPVRPKIKAAITSIISGTGFTIAYSTLSTAVLIWVIVAAGRAPHVVVWRWQPWQNDVVIAGMGIACVIAALAIGKPNPLSFGGRNNTRFDPEHAGIIGWIKHPLLAVLFLWSFTHLIANGDVAHIIVFGVFSGFSLLGVKLINRRKKREFGVDGWRRLSATRRKVSPNLNGIIRALFGIFLYLALLFSHEAVIGVSPLI